MLAPRLRRGEIIGLASPSCLVTPEWAAPIVSALENMGYAVKLPPNLYARGWGYAASPEQRAADFNALIADPAVRLVFFGGGEGADDLLPLLDYDAARANPKLYLSYSDGTSILNALWAKAGIVTYYGQMPGVFPNISRYDLAQFEGSLLGFAGEHVPNTHWRTLTPGTAQGVLTGGYLGNFIFLAATGQIPAPKGGKYVLFLEDHERFNGIEAESALLGRLEQCGIMPHVAGLLFGHYSAPVNEDLLNRLRILGEKWRIPVAYCDDFGHGENHAILPIGAPAALDTAACTLRYAWD